ncbi:MAG: type I-A CRISPR-associated protein Cas7/Csa2 [Nitrososphaerales archaeon]
MYIRLTGRLLINVASLNTAGGAGTNFIEITSVPIVIRTQQGYEFRPGVPAISGNMFKHYHFVHLVELLKDRYPEKFTDHDLRHVALRFPEGMKELEIKMSNKKVKLDNEGEIVENLVTADLHGFLAPETLCRRESLVKFSFFIPTEESLIEEKFGIDAVTHNRVVLNEQGCITEKAGMMIIKRQYSSALFGFSSSLDLSLIGKSQANPNQKSNVSEEERRDRAWAAVIAFSKMLCGELGASTSRALPAITTEELVAFASEYQIPAPVHGFYRDYLEANASLFASYSKVLERLKGESKQNYIKARAYFRSADRRNVLSKALDRSSIATKLDYVDPQRMLVDLADLIK